jgi:hypothetical protein
MDGFSILGLFLHSVTSIAYLYSVLMHTDVVQPLMHCLSCIVALAASRRCIHLSVQLMRLLCTTGTAGHVRTYSPHTLAAVSPAGSKALLHPNPA